MKGEGVLSVAFQGSPERLERLKEMLNGLLDEVSEHHQGVEVSDGWSQSGGWVLEQGGWPQDGGWYLVIDDEVAKVSQPDDALEKVTKSVYVALSKAEQTR
jgi:hypothetical protein